MSARRGLSNDEEEEEEKEEEELGENRLGGTKKERTDGSCGQFRARDVFRMPPMMRAVVRCIILVSRTGCVAGTVVQRSAFAYKGGDGTKGLAAPSEEGRKIKEKDSLGALSSVKAVTAAESTGMSSRPLRCRDAVMMVSFLRLRANRVGPFVGRSHQKRRSQKDKQPKFRVGVAFASATVLCRTEVVIVRFVRKCGGDAFVDGRLESAQTGFVGAHPHSITSASDIQVTESLHFAFLALCQRLMKRAPVTVQRRCTLGRKEQH